VDRPGDWLSDAFFEVPESESVDGGTTTQGNLWHGVTPRWGHSMHPMCSYHGMFPAKLAHYFIQRHSRPGDLVLDPFSGRGTTGLQARVEGRRTISNDLNPLAYVLTRAKVAPPSWAEVTKAVDQLERRYQRRAQREPDVSPDIEMLFHMNTLRQIVFLRELLLSKPLMDWSQTDYMIAGSVAGILHGAHRVDGTSQYLSISMPNTFSMAPSYVRKYIRENGLKRVDQDVFERLRDKLARLYLDARGGETGRALNENASHAMSSSAIRAGSVDLIVTSPPYLRVVNYGTSNWIRLWWLGVDDVSRNQGTGRLTLDAALDHGHGYDSYRTFMLQTFTAARRVLKRNGVAVFVIGDVATPGRPSLALARQIWDDVGAQSGLRLLEFIEDYLPAQNKVSRIWGETKGKATDTDCVLVLARDEGEPLVRSEDIDWDEPYRDGGPDEAHGRLLRLRQAS
jgi:DNA modification methylase